MDARLERVTGKVDRLQRRFPPLAIPVAVIRKLADDQGGNLATVISYWGFLSIFPLMLVLVTVLGFVLSGNEELYDKIVDGAVSGIPFVGNAFSDRNLSGSVPALVVGVVSAVWAGLSITLALQNAMDRVWAVPYRERRDYVFKRLRGTLLLALLGLLSVAGSVTSIVVTGRLDATGVRIAGYVISLGLNLALFGTLFRLLTSREVPTRSLIPGVILAAFGWAVLQGLGTVYAEQVVARAGPTYGAFATVIGLLSWIYLGARILLIAAQLNVVLAWRLWPRGIWPPLTDADRRALTASARMQERHPDQHVEVSFGERDTLLDHLEALHAAGLLTDEELADKRAQLSAREQQAGDVT